MSDARRRERSAWSTDAAGQLRQRSIVADGTPAHSRWRGSATMLYIARYIYPGGVRRRRPTSAHLTGPRQAPSFRSGKLLQRQARAQGDGGTDLRNVKASLHRQRRGNLGKRRRLFRGEHPLHAPFSGVVGGERQQPVTKLRMELLQQLSRGAGALGRIRAIVRQPGAEAETPNFSSRTFTSSASSSTLIVSIELIISCIFPLFGASTVCVISLLLFSLQLRLKL